MLVLGLLRFLWYAALKNGYVWLGLNWGPLFRSHVIGFFLWMFISKNGEMGLLRLCFQTEVKFLRQK